MITKIAILQVLVILVPVSGKQGENTFRYQTRYSRQSGAKDSK